MIANGILAHIDETIPSILPLARRLQQARSRGYQYTQTSNRRSHWFDPWHTNGILATAAPLPEPVHVNQRMCVLSNRLKYHVIETPNHEFWHRCSTNQWSIQPLLAKFNF